MNHIVTVRSVFQIEIQKSKTCIDEVQSNIEIANPNKNLENNNHVRHIFFSAPKILPPSMNDELFGFSINQCLLYKIKIKFKI